MQIRGKTLTLARVRRYLGLVSVDARREMAFRLNRHGRAKLYATFLECRTPEDYFEFARKTFGLTQLRAEILSFLRYVNSFEPRHACEIGTFQGGTNFLIAQSIPSVEMMIGIDLHVQQRSKLHYYCHPDRKVHYLNGSSYAPDTVRKVEALLAGKELDLLFIDGDHRYEGLERDFMSYRHLVKNGGIIAFHDIVPDYSMRFATRTNMWVGDVPIFWSQIKIGYRHMEFVESPCQDGLGIGALVYYKDAPLPEGIGRFAGAELNQPH